mgnify:CR=1 FL=1
MNPIIFVLIYLKLELTSIDRLLIEEISRELLANDFDEIHQQHRSIQVMEHYVSKIEHNLFFSIEKETIKQNEIEIESNLESFVD